MTRVARTVHIEAPAADVWAVMMNIEAWPGWASQFKWLKPLDSGPLALGSSVRVRPKGLLASTWVVTEFTANRSFTWESKAAPGMRLVGGHLLTPTGTGTDAEFSLEASGFLGKLLGPILNRTIFSRNTRSATEGLKGKVESR